MNLLATAVVALLPAVAGAEVTIAVAGDTATMDVAIDGEVVRLPVADVTLDAEMALLPGTTNNVGRREGGAVRFRTTIRWPGHGPGVWTMSIDEVLPEARPVRVLGGSGAPATLVWDGNDAAGRPVMGGAVFEVQLRLSDDDGAVAASPRRRIGLSWGQKTRESEALIRGELFAGDPMRPQATPQLGREVMKLARTLGRDDQLLVEVHDDGTGDRLDKQAVTQKQAELVRFLLKAAGVDPSRVRARGRGNTGVLAPPRTAAAREQNRRVVVTVVSPDGPMAGAAVPPSPATPAQADVMGVAVAVDAAGRFRATVPAPPDGKIALELAGTDGRAVTYSFRASRSSLFPKILDLKRLAGTTRASAPIRKLQDLKVPSRD